MLYVLTTPSALQAEGCFFGGGDEQGDFSLEWRVKNLPYTLHITHQNFAISKKSSTFAEQN